MADSGAVLVPDRRRASVVLQNDVLAVAVEIAGEGVRTGLVAPSTENFVHRPAALTTPRSSAMKPPEPLGFHNSVSPLAVAPKNPGLAVAAEIAGPSDLPARADDAQILRPMKPPEPLGFHNSVSPLLLRHKILSFAGPGEVAGSGDLPARRRRRPDPRRRSRPSRWDSTTPCRHWRCATKYCLSPVPVKSPVPATCQLVPTTPRSSPVKPPEPLAFHNSVSPLRCATKYCLRRCR